jgi:type II secretory pathway pseudopilin PulG
MTIRKIRIPVLRDRGFALVAVMALAAMLILLVMGLLTLATSEARRKNTDQAREVARANARLAVDLALADLQRYLGPDQGISAPASILAKDGEIAPNQSRWTGVWSSQWIDGSASWERDDMDGGLLDKRSSRDAPDREQLVRAWLVSGGAGVNPKSDPGPTAITLVGPGTVGDIAVDQVKVPTIPVRGAGRTGGRLAWWVGDEGVKANVSVPDAHAGKLPVPAQASRNGYAGLLASQVIDETVFTGKSAARLSDGDRRKMINHPGFTLAAPGAKAGFHDVSMVSKGVLANPREGRLKRDLTRWLETGTDIPSLGPNAPGLSAKDPIIGHQSPPRQGRARAAGCGPRFGVLESWANGEAPFSGRNVAARTPPLTSVSEASVPKDAALSNFQPVAIKATDKDGLLPILVEGSHYFTISWHRNLLEGTVAGEKPYQVRLHVYPRVVLWNPYNVELTLEPTMVMIQGNGRQEMRTWGRKAPPDRWIWESQWLWFEGGRSTNFSDTPSILDSEGYTDPHIGSFIFSLPRVTFAPGECLVFSPEEAMEYERPLDASGQHYALEKNLLSHLRAPEVSRNLYLSNLALGGVEVMPFLFWFAPTKHWQAGGIVNQGDDCRVVWKLRGNRTGITFEEFDRLPQLGIISASLQYGAGREPRVAWDRENKVPIEETSAVSPVFATIAPDVRTREGIRLRWHREHLSNELACGPLARTPHFQEAALANWNPRASFAFRSPWDNVAGNLPRTGTAGGPWFFGVYTRDLYDQDVSWYAQMPISKGGRQLGNPFGPPQEGTGRYIVFDVPREETGLLSIGQMMHARTSEFVWHPSSAIGQSLADPRLGNSLDRTAPKPLDFEEARQGGFTPEAIGWSSDAQRGGTRGSWAEQAKLIFQGLPDEANLVGDLSYELNHSLWDDFFLSTGNRQTFASWLRDPEAFPLPNGRFRHSSWTPAASPEKLADFHRAAYHLMIDGAFNVNSTSVEAWKALLGSTRHLGFGPKSAAVFPRFLAPAGPAIDGSTNPDDESLWTGYRALSEAEVDRLAREIVKQVKRRGPFLSLADFVNRRLANDDTGKSGPLQAAIDAAGLNKSIEESYPLDNTRALPDYKHPDNIADATRLEQTLKPATTVWGAPGHLTQGDILQTLGPVLAARSDTFTIRGYGDTTDPNGKILSRAWCEAVVQRIPEPIEPDATGLNSARTGKPGDPGRRFVIVSFRWLDSEEV